MKRVIEFSLIFQQNTVYIESADVILSSVYFLFIYLFFLGGGGGGRFTGEGYLTDVAGNANFRKTWHRGYKTFFFMLNSAEHEIYPAHK